MFRTLSLFALTLLILHQVSEVNAQMAIPGKKVGPDYARPTARTSSQWIDFNHPNLISANHAVEDHLWWNVFGDPEIDRLVNLSHRQNLPLQAALLRIQQSQYERAVAVGNLFPQNQQLSADYQRIQFSQNGTPFGVAGLGQRSFDLFDLGFNASWELDLWGRLRRTVEAADAKVGVTQEDRCDLRLSMTAEVVSAYTEIRIYQQRIANAFEQIQAQEKTLEIATAKFENGSTSNLDVNQAEAVLETTQAGLTELEAGLRAASNRLCLLLGIPPQDLTPDIGFACIPETPDLIQVGVPCDLIRRRPDVRRAECEVAAQSALIGVAKADLYPAFTLSGAVNWQSFAFSELFQSSSQAGTLVPGIRWDILNYGRIKNRVRAQEARFLESVVNYRQTVLNANAEAETALSNYLKKKQQIGHLQRAVAATENAVETSRKQYQGGVIEFDRLNDSQIALVQQLDELAFHKGQAALLLINVYKTMGGGWCLEDATQATLSDESGFTSPVSPVELHADSADSQSSSNAERLKLTVTNDSVNSPVAAMVAFQQPVKNSARREIWPAADFDHQTNPPKNDSPPVLAREGERSFEGYSVQSRAAGSLWQRSSSGHPQLWSGKESAIQENEIQAKRGHVNRGNSNAHLNPLWHHSKQQTADRTSATVYSHYNKSQKPAQNSSKNLWR